MRHKSAIIGFSYLAGLICASFLSEFFAFILSGFLVAASILFFIFRKLPYSVSLFTFGTASAVFALYSLLVYQPVAASTGMTLDLTGTVNEVTDSGNDLCSYSVKTVINGVDTVVTVFTADCGAEYGDTVSFTAKLRELSDNANFAEKSYYKTKGIFLSASASDGMTVVKNDSFSVIKSVDEFREYIKTRVKTLLPNEEGDLLCAFFLGDKSGLSDELKDDITYSGISHFAAVSGLHLTIIAHILMLLLGLTPLKYSRKLTFFILTGFLLLFIAYFRFSPSVVRAGIMLIVYYGAAPLKRKSSTLNSIGFAAILILLFNPFACLDIGFLLSITGTFGIGVVSPAVCKCFKGSWFRKTREMLIGSVCATLCTLPLVALFFGGVSTVGIIVNLVIYPLFLPALVCFIIFTLCGGYGFFLMFFAGLCAKAMTAIITFFADLKYSYVMLDQGFIIPFFVLTVIFTALVYFSFKNVQRAVMACGIGVCMLVFLLTFDSAKNFAETSVTLYSDGDGACVMIASPQCVYVVATDDSPQILTEIKRFQKCNYIDSLSVLCVANSSHNNMSAFSSVSAEKLVISKDDDAEYTSGSVSLICTEAYQKIKCGDFSITVSPISSPCDGIYVLYYGYKKNLPVMNSENIFFSNKRIDCSAENQTNIYFKEVRFCLSENNIITFC